MATRVTPALAATEPETNEKPTKATALSPFWVTNNRSCSPKGPPTTAASHGLTMSRCNERRVKGCEPLNRVARGIPVSREVRRWAMEFWPLCHERGKKRLLFGRAECVANDQRAIDVAKQGHVTRGVSRGVNPAPSR